MAIYSYFMVGLRKSSFYSSFFWPGEVGTVFCLCFLYHILFFISVGDYPDIEIETPRAYN